MVDSAEPWSLESLLGNSAWMRALAAQLLDDDDLADDVVQEVYLLSTRSEPSSMRPSSTIWERWRISGKTVWDA